jgi:hypothetical protein
VRLEAGEGMAALISLCFSEQRRLVGVVGLVRHKAPRFSDDGEKRNSHDHVGDVSGRQRERDRSAAIIGQSMNFARPSAPRAANRFFKLPLFEPLAERWALTVNRLRNLTPPFSGNLTGCRAARRLAPTPNDSHPPS